MDQIKIGRFIAEIRKSVGLTQMKLAEKLNITDRAVSKWENGKSLPDSSIMIELCDELGITVNDLLSGEVVTMENNKKEMEKRILELVREKEKTDRRLLNIEVILGTAMVVFFLAMTVVASVVQMQDWLRIVIIFGSLVPLLIVCAVCIKIEQTAGYYECRNCGHKYVPTFRAVNFAMHMGRTRYMRCPECGKRTWQKKVITKD